MLIHTSTTVTRSMMGMFSRCMMGRLPQCMMGWFKIAASRRKRIGCPSTANAGPARTTWATRTTSRMWMRVQGRRVRTFWNHRGPWKRRWWAAGVWREIVERVEVDVWCSSLMFLQVLLLLLDDVFHVFLQLVAVVLEPNFDLQSNRARSLLTIFSLD